MARLVLSPDAMIRAKQGQLMLHTSSHAAVPPFVTTSPPIVGWIGQFATPQDPDRLVAALPAGDRQAAQDVLAYLVRLGALIEAAPPPAEAESAALDDRQSHQHLGQLAQAVYDLASDLRGFGPHAQQRVGATLGFSVERRLAGLLAAVDDLRSELETLRADYVSKQLAALGLRGDEKNLKLHIGCGPNHLAGWVNIDVHPAPLAMNLKWGLPFKPNSVSHVYMSHLLEHLYYPMEVYPFLEDALRVLAPGGVMRIVVPDTQKSLVAYIENDREFFGSRRRAWDWWQENPTRLEDFLAYSGAGPNPAMLFESHKFGYDYETLERVLTNAGFARVRRCEYMQSPNEALRIDTASAVAGAKYGESYYALFVEAYKAD